MPLYNVMQRGMRLPRIGTIRKGEQVPVIDKDTGQPKKNQAGEIVMRPVERPFWVFHIDPTQQEEVLVALGNAYKGKEITELNVFLALPDAFSNFGFWMEAYNYNQLVARADERVVTFLFDVETNEVLVKDGLITAHSKNPESVAGKLVENIPVGSPLPYDPTMIVAHSKTSGKPIVFKAVGRLNVVIKELRRLVTFTVITGGYWYDIPQIYSTVEILDSIAQATGRGANTIPLKLRRVPRERSFTNEKGEKVRKTYYDIELEIRSDITAGLLETYEASPFAIALQSGKPVVPELGGPEFEEDYGTSVAENAMEAVAVREAPLPPGQKVLQLVEGDEMIDPLGNTPVAWAAQQWNIPIHKAREAIKTNKRFYAPMPKSEFKHLVIEA